MIKCKHCNELKETDEFHKSSASKNGFNYFCKSCKQIQTASRKDKTAVWKAKYYEENKERLLEDQRLSRLKNIEEIRAKDNLRYIRERERRLAYAKEYQINFPEISRAAGRKYRKATPEKQTQKAALRRARLHKAIPSWSNSEWEKFFLQEIYSLSSLRSELTGIAHHVDHIVPLTSDVVCGLHCSSNLRVIEWLDNVKKSNKLIETLIGELDGN